MNSKYLHTIYIAGPMQGYKNYNKEAFFKAEEKLKSNGYEVLNPHQLAPYASNGNWASYLKEDILWMLTADGVFALDNWEHSKGARVEIALARDLEIPVFYSPNLPPDKKKINSSQLKLDI